MRVREKHVPATQRRQRGLTLIEIMVVILILGLIASAVGTNVFGLFAKSKFDQAKTEIQTIKDAIQMYAADNNGFPEELVDLTQGNLNYLKNVDKGEVPLDPWGRQYQFQREDNADGFLVWSDGEKEGDESDDVRSDEIGTKSRSR